MNIFSVLLVSSSIFLSTSTHAQLISQDKFVLIGDTGKDNDGQARVAEAMKNFCKKENCEFGLLAGDNVYPGGVTSPTDPVLERVFDKYYNQLEIPFLVSLGNHDYGEKSNQWHRGDYQLLHAKKNPYFYLPTHYYTFETDHVIFAVIDTTRMMWKKDLMAQETMVFEAYADAMTQNKWFVVIGHHPYLSNGKHGNAGNYERLPGPYFVSGSAVKRFLDKNVCGKAQLYLSGHDHSLQVFDGNIKGCDTQLIVSGTGASATKLYKRNKADFESLELGFFSLDFEKDEVKVKAINDKEEVLFEKNYQRKIPVNEMAKKPLLRPSIHLGLNHR